MGPDPVAGLSCAHPGGPAATRRAGNGRGHSPTWISPAPHGNYVAAEPGRRLLKQRTAIIIAHRLSTVEAADRILVLRRGWLIESGTHKALKAQGGLYAQLARLQDLGATPVPLVV